ncbi:MAG: hypothetical protein J5821_01010 [Alphaproteobacteria bacterium]|nr:hypothetical protein [Alphaproteobacteria bacterium]
MKIFFNWCDNFNDDSEWGNDEEIFSLSIVQREGSFATARVSIKTKKLEHKFARIGIEKDGRIKTIFRGKLISFPLSCEGSIMTVEILSEPSDYQNQLSDFSQKNLKQYEAKNPEIIFDDLFFSEKDNPTVFLEGSSKIFYWNMSTGKLSLSDINYGERTFEISKQDILRNSTQIKLAREPYGEVRLNLSASWIQKVYGYINLMPMITQRFCLNRLNSFTNLAPCFRNSSPSGYSLIFNSVKKINPNGGGILNRFPELSNPVKIKNGSNEKFAKFRRFYFDGKFVLGWEYHQKRNENVSVSICDKSHSRRKDVFIKLGAIQLSKNYPRWYAFKNYLCTDRVIHDGWIFECDTPHDSNENFDKTKWRKIKKVPDALKDDQLSSFFATDRGKSAIRYALRKIAALVNFSRRYVTINFSLDANKFSEISVNDSIKILDLYQHPITAKVIQTKLILDEKNRLMNLSVGYSPDNVTDIFETVQNYDFEINPDKDRVEISDIVKNISIENDPESQENLMTSRTFPSESAAINFLKKHPTKIHVDLHPISQKREIVRTINLKNLEI